tara:strand:+ start:1815 stop:5303 length:3489 start_codon:yes stop_codon:yes gene_type:complete
MKLHSLKVHGFKSFADPTIIEFHEGITAVVGPNGCGKSNISDAIRWVLGEQRPTAIRGAKMEEVIFQGTVGRRPVNRAAVALTVSNEDGVLPVPFEEVEVGRQVFRDGGSEYSINRSSCRLRDVVDLCRDTGLGANAYAIIENRMVDAILSDRADDRRGLFEEAAGIGKYKDRRKAAARRLERAEADLQRLEDVIGEVQSKVRSLARQKGKAERYEEYRTRRLDLEVSVVRHQLEDLSEKLKQVDNDLQTDVQNAAGMVAELSTAEAEFEALRLREVEAEKERSSSVANLDSIREQLIGWERDLAVADERATYAERRLAQIGKEQGDAQGVVTSLQDEESEQGEEWDTVVVGLDEVRKVADEFDEEVRRVRSDLMESRENLDSVEIRGHELVRRGAQLEGDAEACEGQAEELQLRLEKALEELKSTSEVVTKLESQGDLFSSQVDELSDSLTSAQTHFKACQTELSEARKAFDNARAAEREFFDAEAELGARKSALEALERDRQSSEPVLRAVLSLDDPGVLGALVDFMDVSPAAAAAAEAYLGPVTNALIVRDQATLQRVLDWFGSTWDGGGGLILLPLDRVPESSSSASGDLLGSVSPVGDGVPWVRALLAGVDLFKGSDEVVPVTVHEGVVRVGDPSLSSGVLERREELRRVKKLHKEAKVQSESAAARLENSTYALTRTEVALEDARAVLQKTEDEHRRALGELNAQSDRHGVMDRLRNELARQVEGARVARTRVLDRAKEAREDRAILLQQESALKDERQAAASGVEIVQENWEEVRAKEARLAIDVARFEGDLARATERLQSTKSTLVLAEERVQELDQEQAGLREELAETRRLKSEGNDATERLFLERTEAEEQLRQRNDALEKVGEGLTASESRVRQARTAERTVSDRRHVLELESQELGGRIGRIQERLEGEWGRPLNYLLEEAGLVDGDPEDLQDELDDLLVAIERLGPVNMLALEEHAEEKERLVFLTGQREDLIGARNDLRSAIREINKTATELFVGTFEDIRKYFRETFLRLFEGGEADIWLQEAEDPLESPIEIHVSPRGKRTQRIDLLSGGERALTALSLLFGIYLVKPSPFCVLDEVDAPLDENNIGRFIRLLEDFKAETQFVVITHNPRTIEAADWIYGVTMEEPGVSTLVGVKLQEALEAAGAA